jgi:hypothetical protein
MRARNEMVGNPDVTAELVSLVAAFIGPGLTPVQQEQVLRLGFMSIDEFAVYAATAVLEQETAEIAEE